MNFSDENCIGLVCNGEFNAIPGYKIGMLFESYFDNINYNVITYNNEKYVDFTGDITGDDETYHVLIRFVIIEESEEFEIVKVKMNEDVLEDNEIIDLLEEIAIEAGAISQDDIDAYNNYFFGTEDTSLDNPEEAELDTYDDEEDLGYPFDDYTDQNDNNDDDDDDTDGEDKDDDDDDNK